MKIVLPRGHREIEIKDNESINIYLEDFEKESSEFTLEVFLKYDSFLHLKQNRYY